MLRCVNNYIYATNRFLRVLRTPIHGLQLAQWAASRADLFPTLLCDRLGSLHSSGKPHSLYHTKRVIEGIFQRPFDDVFEEFEETPIGCGAIAQVSCIESGTIRYDRVSYNSRYIEQHLRMTSFHLRILRRNGIRHVALLSLLPPYSIRQHRVCRLQLLR